MEELRKSLRPFFAKVSIPPVIIALVVWAVASGFESPLDAEGSAKLMMALMIIIAIAFAVSSFVMHRADGKRIGEDEDKQVEIFAPAYRTRILTLNGCSLLSSVAYGVAHDVSALYLVGILTVVVLLSYPSEQFVAKR